MNEHHESGVEYKNRSCQLILKEQERSDSDQQVAKVEVIVRELFEHKVEANIIAVVKKLNLFIENKYELKCLKVVSPESLKICPLQ